MSDPTHIHRWHRLNETLTTSGQPTEAQLADIRDFGTRHVVNLALHSHELALPDEAASVVALGMTYTHIPVASDAPTEADFARFCAVMADVATRRFTSIASSTHGYRHSSSATALRAGLGGCSGARRYGGAMAAGPRTPSKKGPVCFHTGLRSSAGGTWFG